MFSLSSFQTLKNHILLLKNTFCIFVEPFTRFFLSSKFFTNLKIMSPRDPKLIEQENKLEYLYQASKITYQGVEKDNNNCERITFIDNDIVSDKKYLGDVLDYNKNDKILIPLNLSRTLFQTEIDNFSKKQIFEFSGLSGTEYEILRRKTSKEEYEDGDSCDKKQYGAQLNSFDLFKKEQYKKPLRVI